jgi:hypothetical protein
MSDFFKSALGLFGNQNAAGGVQSVAANAASSTNSAAAAQAANNMLSSRSNNEFVGENIQVGSMKLRVTRVVAEGGYAIVYVAQDLATGVEYALKVGGTFSLLKKFCLRMLKRKNSSLFKENLLS